MAIVRIVAKFNGKTIVLWQNENVNSVFGHLPLRQTGQKEEIGSDTLLALLYISKIH